ncbi:probable LRR receptor-like serine/threonine-protein kinase [Tanacetum coccineum]|uniref:Probable LRR receptor-like serine/threonine-protein kinase n=1 Tax=Tanacetum coccineum TaxID=301880 RepID=A0ABQ5GRP9_9ASTR
MKKNMEIVPDDEVAINAIPLATKPPIIVDWKIIKEGKMGYFQIIRADGSSKRPEESYEGVLWGDLKVMFEPDVESKDLSISPEYTEQSPRGIFICQSQYTMGILKKHGMEKYDTVITSMATTKLDADLQGTLVDQTKYHSMIGGLMHLTASRPDIAFATFVCARYQARPTEKHLKEMQTMQGVMMIAKAHPVAFNFWEISYHLDENTTDGLWISLPQDSDLLFRSDLGFLFHMAQHVIPAAQLVPQYKSIGICNNYAVLRSIPCSPECKINGEQVETPNTPFVAPANIYTIEAFMNKVGYQGVVDKVSAFFTKNLAQPWQTMFKVFNRYLTTRTSGHDQTKINILQLFHTVVNRTNVDYTALLWNTPRAPRTPTVSASPQEMKKRKQTAGESSSRRIIIKKKKPSTPSIPPPEDDRERDEMAEATILSLTLHKTTLDVKAKENIAKVQEMLAQEEIDKLVDGDEDEEYSASAFADTVLNDVDDDTASKLEPESYKEHPEHVSDDDEKKKKDEEVEKEKEVVEIVKDTNVDDTSAKKNEEVVTKKEVVDMSGSQEIRKEKKQTPIPSPIRSPRNDLSSDKTISEELVNTGTPKTATSSKTPSITTHQKKSFSHRTRNLPGIDKDQEVSPVDISGMVSKAFAAHAPKMIEELFRQHMQNTTLNLYPKSRSSTATKSFVDLQQQLYQTMKEKPQDQAADLEIWESLKAKFEKP